MLQFGSPAPGEDHEPRPAAFGVAEVNGKVAVVRIDTGAGETWWDLPGGALDPGEDEGQALAREFGEETGLKVHAGDRITQAAQFFIKSDGRAVNNRGGVYEVTVEGVDPALKIEDDHTLVWLDPLSALGLLRHDSHAWALTCWLRKRR
jgi:8-oxo-dGTP diphosphatase